MGDAQENIREEKKNVMGDSVPQGGPQQVLGGLKSISCFRSPSPIQHSNDICRSRPPTYIL